jgi:hypothetical protein
MPANEQLGQEPIEEAGGRWQELTLQLVEEVGRARLAVSPITKKHETQPKGLVYFELTSF